MNDIDKSTETCSFTCPHCGGTYDTPLPSYLEPLFTINESAQLLGLTRQSVQTFLKQHREIPKRYRYGKGGRLVRMLTAREVRYIRLSRLWERDDKGNLVPYVMRQRRSDFPSIDWDAIPDYWAQRVKE